MIPSTVARDSNSVAGSVDNNPQFTITASGRAFKILSDGLYSDKITAVIRELSCNAYDSHVAAGKPDVPFTVHIPNYDEPWFSVTDYGTGISDVDINTIYTRYFASTKTDSNDYVGQLGLGSKSPFSMVREFKVVSKHAGCERTYRMYFDASDTPRVEFLYEGPTTATGLHVEMQIPNMYDHARFAEKAVIVLGWFKTTPHIIGNQSVTDNTQNRTSGLQGSGWYIKQRSRHSGYSQNHAYALMGNVAYPLDMDSMSNLDDLQQQILALPIVIQFNIGDMEVAASRESLGYDDRTVANIKNRLTAVGLEVKAQYEDRIASAPTLFMAHRKYDEIFGSNNPEYYTLREMFKDQQLLWNGKIVNGSRISADLLTVYDSNKSQGETKVHVSQQGKTTSSRVSWNDYQNWTQPCSRRDIVVFNDEKKNSAARIKHWVKNAHVDDRVTIYSEPDTVSWDQLCDMLGNPAVQLVSKMPQPPKTVRSNSVGMMEFTGNYQNRGWKDVTVDLEAGGFYIDTSNKTPFTGSGRQINLTELIRTACAAGFMESGTVVYAAKGSLKNKISKMKGWVNVCDHLSDKVLKDYNDQQKYDRLATIAAWEDVSYNSNISRIIDMHWDLRDSNGAMSQFLDLSKTIKHFRDSSTLEQASRINAIGCMLGLQSPVGNPDPAVKAIVDQFNNRYPLLQMIDRYAMKDNFAHINHYVDMVDQNWMWFELSRPDQEIAE
jgi:Histidine kinase-, DNA gyrase B-, and HSP90-like ATPase